MIRHVVEGWYTDISEPFQYILAYSLVQNPNYDA